MNKFNNKHVTYRSIITSILNNGFELSKLNLQK